MTEFSRTVWDFWLPQRLVPHGPQPQSIMQPGFQVVIDEMLEDELSVSLLRTTDGFNAVRLTPTRAESLSLVDQTLVGADDLHSKISNAGIFLNGPDHLFYLPAAEASRLTGEEVPNGTRQLTANDATAFTEFESRAPKADRDEAFVELDHWLVFGTFDGDRLVAAASMYPWRGSLLADLGVLTLPEYRRRGLARTTIRALSQSAISKGFEPQYRCQFDNESSVAAALAAGFSRFGDWDVIESEGEWAG